MVLSEDYTAPVSMTFVPCRESVNTGDIYPGQRFFVPLETVWKQGKRSRKVGKR